DRRAGDVEDLAAQGQDRLGDSVARLLGRAAGAVAFDEKDLGAFGAVARAVGELAREAQLARRRFARQLFCLAPLLPLLGALRDAVEEEPGRRRVGAEPVVEMVPKRVLDQPRRLGRSEALFGLPLE